MPNRLMRWRPAAITLCAVSALLYALGLLDPALGMDREEAAMVALVRPWLALDADAVRWLRLVPFVCTVGWLLVLRRLLHKLGAGHTEALVITVLTMVAPVTIGLATHLDPEPWV